MCFHPSGDRTESRDCHGHGKEHYYTTGGGGTSPGEMILSTMGFLDIGGSVTDTYNLIPLGKFGQP